MTIQKILSAASKDVDNWPKWMQRLRDGKALDTPKAKCTYGNGFCPVHQAGCEVHYYLCPDGKCTCLSCAHKVIKPKKPRAYYKEVHDRLWKLRNTNPRWEMVFQEKSRVDMPDYTPVVEGTMTVLPDGTLAYLFDAGPPHPRDVRMMEEEKRIKAITQDLKERHKEGGWRSVSREVLDLVRYAIQQARVKHDARRQADIVSRPRSRQPRKADRHNSKRNRVRRRQPVRL